MASSHCTIHSCSSSICPSSCYSSDNETNEFEDINDSSKIFISTYQHNIECTKCRQDNRIIEDTDNDNDEEDYCLIERFTSMKEGVRRGAIDPGPPIVTNNEERGPDGANLFVFHLPNGLTNFDLFLLFRRFGDLRSSHIMINKENNISRGYGFVSYSSKEEADIAINAMNGFLLGSKKLKVERKRPHQQLQSSPRSSSRRSSFSFESNSASSQSRQFRNSHISSTATNW